MTDQQLAIKRKIHEILWGENRAVSEDLFDAVDRIAIAWDAELAQAKRDARNEALEEMRLDMIKLAESHGPTYRRVVVAVSDATIRNMKEE